MKRLYSALLAALLFFAPVPDLYAKIPRILESVRPLSVESPEYDGTLKNICSAASINQRKRYWLTAAHCISASNIDYYIGGMSARVLMRDVPGDVAIMATNGVQVRALKLANDAPEYGDKVEIGGYPWGWASPIYNVGIVMNPNFRPFPGDGEYDQEYMLISAQGAPGNSGSVVVNDDNEVVGVVQIGWNRTWSVLGTATWEYLQRFKRYWSEK